MKRVVSNLPELMAKNKVKSLSEIQRETGLNRVTLTKIYKDEANRMDFGTTVKLCDYLNCKINDLYKLVDEDEYEKLKKRSLDEKIERVKGVVYFLKDKEVGLVKIGRTTDLEKRIKSLEYEYETNLELLAKLPSDNVVNLEKKMHLKFKESNFSGEWFKLSESDIQKIRNLEDEVIKEVR